MKHILVCEDNVEGILTAVFLAWELGYGHENTGILTRDARENETPELFCEYHDVETDSEKVQKVIRGIREKISEEAFQIICRVAASSHSEKADAIYRFVILGLRVGKQVTQRLTAPEVMKMFELNRYLGNEIHLYLGFLRFLELSNGVLLARYQPNDNITPFLMPHFCDRLSGENFLVLDTKRHLLGVHENGEEWFMTELTNEEAAELSRLGDEENLIQGEEQIENLWKTFFHSVTIEERKNLVCQRNHIPIHYRGYMPEFLLPYSKNVR